MKKHWLKSSRFWAMIIGATIVYLEAKGWIGEAERNLAVTIAGGFFTVKTADKYVDKLAANKE